jgi:hypothetical protein
VERVLSAQTATLGDASGPLRCNRFITMNDLDQAYKELYQIVYEKLFFGYEVDPDCLMTLDKLKGEVELDDSPFLVLKKLQCSICGKEIIRQKKFKKVVCFDCQRQRQRIYNSSYKPAVSE